MSVKERIREYVKFRHMSERAFCLSIGVAGAYINNIKVSIAPDKIERIAKAYPDLNLTWLMTGQGEMLNGEANQSNKSTNPQQKVASKPPVRSGIFDILTPEMVAEITEKMQYNEVASLKREIESAKRENESLKRENDTLREMIDMLKRQLQNPGQHSKAC